ncbi:hypothetical protein KNT81_gp143 [Proteus phage phiP4-3]|uniref:Uncharacterized protein n=1 Tax=Proteus phage phiP4-3 TaxID=2065203 RepID=A0A2I6PFX3_9CAUD|nr:hypothetical protein KNT81_gp143 [Proteus phage phiP4-3]AUM58628.1 hypothetical protein phiP43_270 [Proteus phage phiP4-3]AZV01389.1 hypothetical protein vBSdyM006_252 [Shigella phage vB_SdyM_006]
MKSIERRFGKAKYGCAVEREYLFGKLLQVEAQINSCVISGREPSCGLSALREVKAGYHKDIKELSK